MSENKTAWVEVDGDIITLKAIKPGETGSENSNEYDKALVKMVKAIGFEVKDMSLSFGFMHIDDIPINIKTDKCARAYKHRFKRTTETREPHSRVAVLEIKYENIKIQLNKPYKISELRKRINTRISEIKKLKQDRVAQEEKERQYLIDIALHYTNSQSLVKAMVSRINTKDNLIVFNLKAGASILINTDNSVNQLCIWEKRAEGLNSMLNLIKETKDGLEDVTQFILIMQRIPLLPEHLIEFIKSKKSRSYVFDVEKMELTY